jgi:hypothetical protein
VSVKVVKNADGTFGVQTVDDDGDVESSGLDSEESIASGMYSCSDSDDGGGGGGSGGVAPPPQTAEQNMYREKARRLSISKLGRQARKSSIVHKARKELLKATNDAGVVRL